MTNILEFHDHIRNHHEKCIEISTNMPGIGSLIHEIDVNISKSKKANLLFLLSKTMAVFQVLDLFIYSNSSMLSS